MSARALSLLESFRDNYTPVAAAHKRAALLALLRSRLATADQVRRLHEVLCFLRAWPDDAEVLQAVEHLLAGFSRRADLRAHREALLTPLESHALRESHLPGYAALDRLRGERSDATFLLDRVAAMAGTEAAREALYDLINPSCELRPAPGVPSRTRARFTAAPTAWQTTPLHRERPDLRAELQRPPRRLRRLALAGGEDLLTLARGAMITRQRDLDTIAWGDARDVWLADDGGGLAFALIGTLPSRRAALPALYGGLTLKNGVPVGYFQADFLGRAAAVSFNTFDTFRGGESALQFARLLSTLRAFASVTSFSIEPYQLGLGNEEGIASGAWWFYFKLGFRPRARAALRLAARESMRQRARTSYRSPLPVLRQLARHHVFYDLDPKDRAALLLPSHIGLRIGAALARLDASSREAAVERAGHIAMQRLGLPSLLGFSREERSAWTRLAPLIAALPTDLWSAGERMALVRLVRAKGARSERRYAQLCCSHRPFETALVALSAK